MLTHVDTWVCAGPGSVRLQMISGKILWRCGNDKDTIHFLWHRPVTRGQRAVTSGPHSLKGHHFALPRHCATVSCAPTTAAPQMKCAGHRQKCPCAALKMKGQQSGKRSAERNGFEIKSLNSELSSGPLPQGGLPLFQINACVCVHMHWAGSWSRWDTVEVFVLSYSVCFPDWLRVTVWYSVCVKMVTGTWGYSCVLK